jgi:DNA-binding XRE family transcriptional regulator
MFATHYFPSLPLCEVDEKSMSIMKKSPSFRNRDYAFGQAMLALRTAMGLTQAGVAEQLGVSRKTVGEWEASHIPTLSISRPSLPWLSSTELFLLGE